MAISPEIFPPRKRRPSLAAFVSPKLPDLMLLRSLHHLSLEIASLEPLRFLLRRNSLSIIRKSELLAVLFEELLQQPSPSFSHSELLCFEEMYIILQRAKTLIEDCSNGSKTWLLMQIDSVSNSFHEVTVDLSTLLDIFPVSEVDLSDDVREIVVLVRRQSAGGKTLLDSRDAELRNEVITMLERIKLEIVPDPDKLSEIFQRLGLRSLGRCTDEIESLEEEIRNQKCERSKSEIINLIGLLRYGKCVLLAASSSTPSVIRMNRRSQSVSDSNVPSDFRCPISLDLMRDPVVVATGQTYDRGSIGVWIESGHNTCPKTGQALAHTTLIPNLALRNLIALWCREQRIPFEETDKTRNGANKSNKTALEATKMTASFLVNKLVMLSSSDGSANGIVHELRVLAKTDSDNRACIAEAGAIPSLVRFLSCRVDPTLQLNAVTTMLNLSILEPNKATIVDTDGALNGVIEVLRSGATWEAKGNAAATIFSLSSVQSYRKKLGRKARVVKGLIDLARDGPAGASRDAMVAIMNMSGDRETVGRLIELGIVEVAAELVSAMPEEAAMVIEAVVKRGGLAGVAAGYGAIRRVSGVLRVGSDKARESVAATLVTLCRKGGCEVVAEVAAVAGVERVVWEVMGTGTPRGRRKAATLLRILRRWAAGLDGNYRQLQGQVGNGNVNPPTSRIVISS